MSSTLFIGAIVAMGLYSLGGWLGGRFYFTKSFRENVEIARANFGKPMPPLARTLQWLGFVVGVAAILASATTAHAAPVRELRPVFGTTPEEIHASFPINMDQNMRANGNFHVHNLRPVELANLAALYQDANHGSTASILQILAQNVDAEGLTRVAAAFGQAATEAAVKRYSKPDVALAFASSPRKAVVPATITRAIPKRLPAKGTYGGYMLRVQTTPNLDMSLYDIYLNYRTLPVGSLSVGASLVQTSVYSSFWLVGAWTAGYTVGTAVNSFLNNYFPDATIILGDTIGNLVDDIKNSIDWTTSTTTPETGHHEYDLNGAIQSAGSPFNSDGLDGSAEPSGSSGDYGVYSDGCSWGEGGYAGGGAGGGSSLIVNKY